MPTAQMAAHSTVTITKTNSGAILFHHVGPNFDSVWYDVYVPAKKMWASPSSADDGSYTNESTSQTGKTVVWSGSTYYPSSGKTFEWRDTFVNGAEKFSYVGEQRSGGTWQKQYAQTCTKT